MSDAVSSTDLDNPFQVTWHARAACYRQGFERYFHEGKLRIREVATEAKSYCNEPCPVKDLCLKSSLIHEDRYGIWGGLTPKERARLLSRVKAGELTIDEAVEEVCG